MYTHKLKIQHVKFDTLFLSEGISLCNATIQLWMDYVFLYFKREYKSYSSLIY